MGWLGLAGAGLGYETGLWALGGEFLIISQSRCTAIMPRSSAERVILALLGQVDELKRRRQALIARASSAKVETVVFFDCDDCIYQNGWKTADKITASIASYAKNNLSLPEGVRTYDLYRKHGTTAKGLLAEGFLDEAGVQHFLSKAHEIDYR